MFFLQPQALLTPPLLSEIPEREELLLVLLLLRRK
jgi:hypothetical protein